MKNQGADVCSLLVQTLKLGEVPLERNMFPVTEGIPECKREQENRTTAGNRSPETSIYICRNNSGIASNSTLQNLVLAMKEENFREAYIFMHIVFVLHSITLY